LMSDNYPLWSHVGIGTVITWPMLLNRYHHRVARTTSTAYSHYWQGEIQVPR
jgi:hypothetical protein